MKKKSRRPALLSPSTTGNWGFALDLRFRSSDYPGHMQPNTAECLPVTGYPQGGRLCAISYGNSPVGARREILGESSARALLGGHSMLIVVGGLTVEGHILVEDQVGHDLEILKRAVKLAANRFRDANLIDDFRRPAEGFGDPAKPSLGEMSPCASSRHQDRFRDSRRPFRVSALATVRRGPAEELGHGGLISLRNLTDPFQKPVGQDDLDDFGQEPPPGGPGPHGSQWTLCGIARQCREA